MPIEHIFANSAKAASHLAARIATLLGQALETRGAASLALSGGQSPKPVLQALAAAPLDWSRIVVTLVDERWVAPDHADSNERLLREILLAGPAEAAQFIPMKNEAADAYSGQPTAETALASIPWPLDVILLGMGEDGHTASLFPLSKELAAGLTSPARTIATMPPAAPHQRLSLTASAIKASTHIFLQISGPAKRAVYQAALANGPAEQLPIRLALHQTTTPVEVWISE